MKAVAIIPARGGSKRIPRKNIRPFAGRPIIAHSIDVARRSGLFERIVVTTDDAEIADVALKHGAEVPFMREARLADDHAGTIPVVGDAVRRLKAAGTAVDLACCIYATAPFVTVEALSVGHRMVATGGFVYAFTATTFPHPVQRALVRTPAGGVTPMFPEAIGSRSQDLPVAIHDAGQFYWGNAHAFEEELPVFTERAFPILLPRSCVQDIDTEEDWTHAELLFAVLSRNDPPGRTL